jgi:hypothetical protein
MKNKQMRITIDGPSNTGKTMLAWKIAEFLKLCGVAGENITFFNDNAEQISDPAEIETRINSGLSRDMWQHTDFAIVERAIAPSGSAMGDAWAAKPEVYSPVFRNMTHVDMEMGRWQPMRISYPGSEWSSAEVMECHYGLGREINVQSMTAEQVATAGLSEDGVVRDLQDVRDQLHARGLEPTTLQDVREWLNSTGKVVPAVSVSTIYAMRDNWDALRLQLTTLGEPMSEGALSIARTVLWGNALSFDQALRRTPLGHTWAEPLVEEGLSSMLRYAGMMGQLKEAALHPELTIADGEAAVSYSGTVLGHPVSIPARRLHSYGNYTPEELAKYKPQVHPTTGETREQMYERSAAGREAKMNDDGQVGISFKGLPRDLVFDPRCGVRWYTEEELAKEGMRYPNVLEFKHSGARLMPNVTEPTTQPGAQIVRGGDGAVLMTWVPTDAPSDGKAPDPALEPRREERDSALNQRLHEAARNLGNITELGISGRVELPKLED